jgi:hypothetical protein
LRARFEVDVLATRTGNDTSPGSRSDDSADPVRDADGRVRTRALDFQDEERLADGGQLLA